MSESQRIVQRFFADIKFMAQELGKANEEICLYTGRNFSVFKYIVFNENMMSDILRDLLDPHGEHGQGAAFLRQFFLIILKEREEQLPHLDDCFVLREACTDLQKRLDIFIRASDWCLVMENKLWAIEQKDQLDSYYRYALNFYGTPEKIRLVFLTPRGTAPLTWSNKEKKTLNVAFARSDPGAGQASSYMEDWLNSCMSVCRADKIRWFLYDFNKIIRKEVGAR